MSTIDAIFVVRHIKEKAIQFNKTTCFIDLAQAFHTVRLRNVLKLLRKIRTDSNILNILKEFNTENYTNIRTGNNLKIRIPISNGIREVDSLHHILFNVIMDEIMKIKRAGDGYRMGDEEIKILRR